MTYDVVDLEERLVLTQIQAPSGEKAKEIATLLFIEERHFVGIREHNDFGTLPVFAYVGA